MPQGCSDVFIVFRVLSKQNFSYSFHEAPRIFIFKKQHFEVLTRYKNFGVMPYKNNLTKLHLEESESSRLFCIGLEILKDRDKSRKARITFGIKIYDKSPRTGRDSSFCRPAVSPVQESPLDQCTNVHGQSPRDAVKRNSVKTQVWVRPESLHF